MEEIRRDELLSIEQARTNPEKFKDELIRYIETNTELGAQVWGKLNREGTILVSDIAIDSTTWVSETRIAVDNPERKTVRLGVQDIPTDVIKQVFPNTSPTGAETKAYRFTHELAHEVAHRAYDGSDKVKQLYALVRGMRGSGSGISGLGSIAFYHRDGDPDRPATEDIVELFNMFITSKMTLRSHLDFLSDPSFEEKRKSLRLASFSDPRVRVIVEDALDEGTQAFLANNK